MSLRLLQVLTSGLRLTLIDVPRRFTAVHFYSQTVDLSESNTVTTAPTKSAADDMPVLDMANPFDKEKPKCILCTYDVTPNYKNVKLLSQFVSPFTGRVYGRQITRLCKEKQHIVEREILKSQNCGLMPYYFKQPYLMKDPKLFDPENPLRPHRF